MCADASGEPDTALSFCYAAAAADLLVCPNCKACMKLVALVTEPKSILRYLAALGEVADVPSRSPSRGPPYWQSTVLRQKALGDVA